MITGKWKPKEWISTKEDKYQELLKYYNLEYAFNKALDHVDAHMDEDDDIGYWIVPCPCHPDHN